MRKSGKLTVLYLFCCFCTVSGGFAQSPGMPAAGGPESLAATIWVSKAPKGIVSGGKGDRQGEQGYYIALFNIGETDRNVSVDFSAVGLRGKVLVRDLWKRADAGVFTKRYTTMIAAHGAVLIKAATQAK